MVNVAPVQSLPAPVTKTHIFPVHTPFAPGTYRIARIVSRILYHFGYRQRDAIRYGGDQKAEAVGLLRLLDGRLCYRHGAIPPKTPEYLRKHKQETVRA